MDIMELGAIGEMVGGVAVLVTLGYLAVQVRQNTASNRVLATQNLVVGHAGASLLLAENGDLAAILQTAAVDSGREGLEPHSQLRFNVWLVGLWSHVELAYFQYSEEQLDERIWKRMEDEIETFLTLPGTMAWWTNDKTRFSPDFVELVDRKLASARPAAIRPTMGQITWDGSRPEGQ